MIWKTTTTHDCTCKCHKDQLSNKQTVKDKLSLGASTYDVIELLTKSGLESKASKVDMGTNLDVKVVAMKTTLK